MTDAVANGTSAVLPIVSVVVLIDMLGYGMIVRLVSYLRHNCLHSSYRIRGTYQ